MGTWSPHFHGVPKIKILPPPAFYEQLGLSAQLPNPHTTGFTHILAPSQVVILCPDSASAHRVGKKMPPQITVVLALHGEEGKWT